MSFVNCRPPLGRAPCGPRCRRFSRLVSLLVMHCRVAVINFSARLAGWLGSTGQPSRSSTDKSRDIDHRLRRQQGDVESHRQRDEVVRNQHESRHVSRRTEIERGDDALLRCPSCQLQTASAWRPLCAAFRSSNRYWRAARTADRPTLRCHPRAGLDQR